MAREFFLKRYEKLGHKLDVEKLREEYNSKKFIRVNTLKTSKKNLMNRLSSVFDLKEVSEITEALEIVKLKPNHDPSNDNKKFSMSTMVEYLKGYFYTQDLFSMIPVTLFDFSKVNENTKILDATAAPGSKTTQIAQYIENKGEIIAVDNKSQRLKKLNNNLERMGVKNTITILGNINDENFLEHYENYFDFILLDAPCSGNFVNDKEWFEKRDIDGVKYNSDKQKEILDSCFKLLKKGGELIYSTCSLEPEEDEENVEYFLNEHKGKIEGVELKKIFNAEKPSKNALKFWPEKTKGQGFFVAKFKKI